MKFANKVNFSHGHIISCIYLTSATVYPYKFSRLVKNLFNASNINETNDIDL